MRKDAKELEGYRVHSIVESEPDDFKEMIKSQMCM